MEKIQDDEASRRKSELRDDASAGQDEKPESDEPKKNAPDSESQGEEAKKPADEAAKALKGLKTVRMMNVFQGIYQNVNQNHMTSGIRNNLLKRKEAR